jgi:PAS domain S-box-containing protein
MLFISNCSLFNQLAMKLSVIKGHKIKSKQKTPESILKEKLISSELRYRRLFESAKDGILILDATTGKIIDANPFLIHLLGFTKEEFIEKEIWQIGLFRDIAANKEKFQELQQQEYVRYENLPLETADGRKINVEFVSNVYLENHKKIIQCNIRDITERKKKENALIDSELRRRTLLQTIPDLIWSKDMDGKYLSCNTMFERFLGAREAEIIGKTDYDFTDKELADFFQENDRKAMKEGKPVSNEEWVTFAEDGHRVYLETIKAPMFDSLNKITGILGIGRDITQRKRFEIELIQSKEKAEESDLLKTAFLANMSHEIRTPMNGILGFTELLKEPMLTGEEQKEYIDIIEKSGARMLKIINNIVSMSKIESGQMEITISETDINEQLEYVFNFFKPEAEKKNLQISYKNQIPFQKTIIKTDKEKVTAILINLVDNAIKFTTSGFIKFGYEKKANWLEFFVIDTGIGVTPDQKDLIFERFRQGSESLSRNYEGAGLGLSISKAYVELLGGKIWVDDYSDSAISNIPGKRIGSIFHFTIPDYPKQQENIAGIADTLNSSTESHIKNLKILIAEDDENSQAFISIATRPICKEMIKVDNGVKAVEACRKNPDINLVLMDIKMPEMDGYEATRQIREFNKKVIIIAQTAYGLAGDREEAIAAGCNEYVSKPINLATLNNLIKKLFT